MNFFIFFLYFFLSVLICFLIGLFIFKLFVKKKCHVFSDIASKEIDKYFNAYDNNFNNDSDFLDQIHEIDNTDKEVRF